MPEEQSATRGEGLALTTDIVAAHLSNNAMANSAVPALIQSVFDKLMALASDGYAIPVELTPAVPIKR